MKKQLLNLALFTLIGFCANAQSKIKDGTVTGSSNLPASNAILELESNNKGFILPRVALTNTTDITTVAAPVNGMMVYATVAQGNITPGLHYFENGSWKRLPYVDQTTADTNVNATVKTFAYVGPYTGQNVNGIKVGDFSFKVARRTGTVNYTTSSENCDVQVRYSGADTITISSYANTLYADAQFDFANQNSLAPTATSTSSAARTNNTMAPALWYGWGEPGFVNSLANIEKRQYIMTPLDVNAGYFYRIEVFMVDPTPSCPTCNVTTPSENDAKIIIFVEYVSEG